LPRNIAATSSQVQHTYVRTRKRPRNAPTIDIFEEDNDQQEHIDQQVPAETTQANGEGIRRGGGEGKLMVMLISFVWMKICYFRLVCSFAFSYLSYSSLNQTNGWIEFN
jgi:hypothetical protein